jgi:hypothetical protein
MENAEMKSFNTKLALAAVAIAIVATPALAQTQRQNYSYQAQSAQHYPNGALRGGAQSDYDSGAMFNQGQ